MGIIAKILGLFSGTATPVLKSSPLARPRERNATLQGGWLTLSRPSFIGQAHCSPNKRWIVGVLDSDGAGIGGYREAGPGRVVLVDQSSDRVMHELKSFARPSAAAVSDTGSYLVQDDGFGSALHGEVVAIGVDGRERYRRHYRANVISIGLSRCGRYAAVQTANASGADGNLLDVLDLESALSMFAVQPTSGWADQYFFDVDAGGQLTAVGVEHNGLGRFTYSASGVFQDEQRFQGAQLERADVGTKILDAQDLLKANATPDNARAALSAADAALAEGARDTSDWGAIAHRVRGEAYEALGNLPEALEAFELALSLNPKVGVQRRATALRKKLRPVDFFSCSEGAKPR